MLQKETVFACYKLARLIIDLNPPIFEQPTGHVVMSEKFWMLLVEIAQRAARIREDLTNEEK